MKIKYKMQVTRCKLQVVSHAKCIMSILLVCIGMIGSFSRGQSTNGDCEFVRGNIVSLLVYDSPLLPEKAWDRANKNLKVYCCEQKILKQKDKKSADPCENIAQDAPGDQLYPQSNYLFDHLIDVMLRRLDGNAALIYADVPLHPKGEARRQGINEKANKSDGVLPMEIISFAQPYWFDNGVPVDNIYHLDNVSLRGLYGYVCKTASVIYGNTDMPGKVLSNTMFDRCIILVQGRIYYELQYIKVLTNLASNRALEKFMTKHLSNYYASTRLMQLQSTIAQMVDAFAVVNKFVVEGTKQCSI